MGRLIDADKLKAQFPEPTDWLDINQTLVHKTGIWAEIDAADTVEAIPVEWIKEKIQSLRNENSYTSYHLSECYKSLLIDWKRGKKIEPD